MVQCQICERPINNPVCSECRMKEINYWFFEHQVNPSEIKKIQKLLKKRFYLISSFFDICILCKEENANICNSCFFSVAEDSLERNDKKLAREFSKEFKFLEDENEI